MLKLRGLVAIAICSIAASAAQADVKLPSIFGSGMVLQREMPVPVWGWAEPGEQVTVSFRDQSQTAQADAQGNWKVKLNPLALGEPGALTVKGKNSITLDNVLVGEVWVCSGQSNMQWSVNAALDPDLEKASANFPQIRLFQVPLVTANEPQKDVKAQWQVCSPATIGNFTAVGYFFGRDLHQILDVPVGLIQTAWGGTRAEAWTSPDMMAKTEELQPILEGWKENLAHPKHIQAQKDYEAAVVKWEESAKAAQAAGKPAPQRPKAPDITMTSQHYPSNLYNAMVSPLVPYAIRGAIWYQGESNASRAYQYRKLMPAMIQSWRDAWGQGDFPFYQVQLANFRPIKPDAGESDWAELREAQHMAAKTIPNVDAVCITDIGAAQDIHPKDKQNVGKRLVRMALVDLYGVKNIVRQGPTFDSVTFDGKKAVVKFDTHGANLVSYYKEPLTGFAVAGEDKKWVWAEAKITAGDTVEVTAAGVDHPVAVRYNWSDNPQGTLFSEAYLPAYPFRSDTWEGVTAKNVKP
ncbi:sialate O-acetylesterase [Planctomicrobium piriforme]|uniref:Sialate O-acetylesterase n=1 Tax=Planctomicrobium piriforme TaxID=1576369 RepID=A0A1I3QWH7_9PLAN|nr:sialate O-acetylesterase [Planctomicrobium piriforme]SFJ38235.1 sialate O-acetylesterase [Planctomicrobium piriforme]